jgi:hypothetical protein
LKSERSQALWIDLQSWQDALAGPLYSISETAGCAYVYERQDAHFHGVTDPTALRERLRAWHGELVSKINQFVPTSADEVADLGKMRQFVADISAVVEMACEIERRRWEGSAAGTG